MGAPVQKRLLLSAISNWLAFAAALLVSFFLTPYMIRRLGAGPYGVWAFVESLLAYLTLFDLGIAACVVRYVAKFHQTGEADRLRGLLSTTWFLFVGLGCGAVVVGMAIIPWSVAGMTSSGVPKTEAIAFGLLMLANLALTLPLSVFPAILDGLERYGSKSVVRLVIITIRTGVLIATLENGGSLWDVGLVIAVANIVEHVIMALLCRRYLPVIRFRWKFVNRESFHEIRGYGTNAFLAMIAGRVTVQSGTLIVAAFLGMGSVTTFAIVSRLVEMAKSMLRTAITTLTPAISSLEAAGRHDQIRATFLKATRFVLYLILPVQAGFVIFGKTFLNLWLKDPIYGETCYEPLVVLSLPLSLVMAQSVAARILYGTGRLTGFARMCLVEAAVNLALSIALCKAYGLIGLMWGIVLPNILMNLWTIQEARRSLNLPLANYVRQSWLKPLFAIVVPTVVWWLLAGRVESWFTLLAVGAAGSAPYALLIAGLELPVSRWLPGRRSAVRRLGTFSQAK